MSRSAFRRFAFQAGALTVALVASAIILDAAVYQLRRPMRGLTQSALAATSLAKLCTNAQAAGGDADCVAAAADSSGAVIGAWRVANCKGNSGGYFVFGGQVRFTGSAWQFKNGGTDTSCTDGSAMIVRVQ